METLLVALIVGLALFFTFRQFMKMITAKGSCGCSCSCDACKEADSCGALDKFFHAPEDGDCCSEKST
jgi:hypothetical protein